MDVQLLRTAKDKFGGISSSRVVGGLKLTF
jgi:hypothetical protein